MNRNLLPFLLLSTCLFYLACDESNPLTSSPIDAKHEPYDMAFFQRSYPDKTFDIAAYKQALQSAVTKQKSSVSTPDGFDTDWTTQGPGNAGARINVIEIDPNNDDIIFLGFSGGGIWRSVNNGASWTSVFDESTYLAIGAIAVDPTDSDIVYAGTGDPNITAYPAVGNGVYKSEDGGTTWTSTGLENMGIITKIEVDPTNNSVIYASCQGSPFERNNDRGLYKSTNGGSTWTQVLFISDQAGVIDFVLDPVNTNRIYACGWDRIRSSTESFADGPGGRIFRSTNGGDTWSMMTNGLPTDTDLSRSSLSMSASDPNIIYASIVDSTFRLKGIYKTTNGGDSWTTQTDGESNGLSSPLSSFGWYFGRIFVNPNNDDHIFLCGVRLWNSQSGGNGWNLATPSTGVLAPHVDNHYMAFDSEGDTYVATDGGLYRRNVGGTTWFDVEDIPATQFYRVGYNPHEPDVYYGGAQDNGTQVGHAGIINNWLRDFGGDGFQPVFNPDDDHNYFYETQRGDIWVTFDSSGFTAATFGINTGDRVHWDMQYIMSTHDSDIMYTGTYRVYKSTSGGNPAWGAVSGDLTDGNIYGSSFHTISTIDESPVDSLNVYVGTTDGNVWRSLDAGNNWFEITSGLPDRYVTCVKAHPNEANGLYVSHSGYRMGENSPHLHYSDDNGDTWTDISGDLPALAINHIEIMPNNFGSVIFVATDGGVYATLNGGLNWNRLGADFPYIPTYDLDLNVAHNLLIAGTFGRSIKTFPLDSIGVSFSPPAVVNIAGQITTAAGAQVDSVMLELDYGTVANTQSDAAGLYNFDMIPAGNNATLTPTKNINVTNGLSTFDLVQIKKHILNIDTLDSPYKIIAADINKSKSVSSFDIILLTKVVLEIDSVFSNNDSWRFVQSDYVFPDPLAPYNPDFPESYLYNPLAADQLNADFIAIKVGDVTGNANPGNLANADGRDFVGELNLQIEDQYFEKGEQVDVAVTATNFEKLLGYQFTMGFDTEVLTYEATEQLALAEKGSQNFGYSHIEEGIITTNWSDAYVLDLSEDAILFKLSFTAKTAGLLSDHFYLAESHTSKEAYQNEEDFLDVQLSFTPTGQTETDEIDSNTERPYNQPNPFGEQGTSIIFEMPEADYAGIEIYSASGELIYFADEFFPKGKNEISLSAYIFPSKGVYLYQIKTATDTKIGKMLKL